MEFMGLRPKIMQVWEDDLTQDPVTWILEQAAR